MNRSARFLRDNALGLVAITIALSAGAYAVDKAPPDSVVSSSIKNRAVKNADLHASSVGGGKVRDNSLTGQDIDESSLVLNDAGGTVTSVTAGSGLQGGTITDTGTISLKPCAASQILVSTGTDYSCGADQDTNTTYAGNSAAGIELTGNAFGLKTCSNLQVLKATATPGVWNCAFDSDTDTNTTYAPGAGLQLDGTTFSIANGGVGSTQIADDSITAADLGFVKSAGLGGGLLADGSCASAIISQTAQFAPGAPGDFTLTTTNPAMPYGFVLSGQVGPVVSGFREYYLSACNLTGTTANYPAATIKMLVVTQ